jgi:prevent-host-death family protein
MTKTIGARELKNRLGTYLGQVRQGATIVVTDRGKPVAELRAVAPAKTDEEARLEELVAAGLVAPRTGEKLTERRRTLRISGPPLSEAIAEDREDRF